ncbi:MAG: cupin [Vicingaceae bacterium]|nr:cupin [Vicingaceae bacterium]
MKTASFLKNIEYNETKPAISVMLETDFSKEIRIVFKAKQLMAAHKALKPIVVEIIDGAIDFDVIDSVHHLTRGDIIALEANVSHSLKAIKNSVVRLTLSKSDTA